MLFKDGPWKSNNTYVKSLIFLEYYYKILWHLQKGCWVWFKANLVKMVWGLIYFIYKGKSIEGNKSSWIIAPEAFIKCLLNMIVIVHIHQYCISPTITGVSFIDWKIKNENINKFILKKHFFIKQNRILTLKSCMQILSCCLFKQG